MLRPCLLLNQRQTHPTINLHNRLRTTGRSTPFQRWWEGRSIPNMNSSYQKERCNVPLTVSWSDAMCSSDRSATIGMNYSDRFPITGIRPKSPAGQRTVSHTLVMLRHRIAWSTETHIGRNEIFIQSEWFKPVKDPFSRIMILSYLPVRSESPDRKAQRFRPMETHSLKADVWIFDFFKISRHF